MGRNVFSEGFSIRGSSRRVVSSGRLNSGKQAGGGTVRKGARSTVFSTSGSLRVLRLTPIPEPTSKGSLPGYAPQGVVHIRNPKPDQAFTPTMP